MKKKILISLLFLLLPISAFAVTTDTKPPVFNSVSFKETVDLKPNQKVYLDLDATDDVSGIETIYMDAVRMTNGKYENYNYNTEQVNIMMKVYYDEDNKELPYLFLGNLVLMASDDFNKGKPELFKRLLHYTDNVLNSEVGGDIKELFVVEVLEGVIGLKGIARLVKETLNNESLIFLDKVLEYYGTDEFIKEYRGL